MQFAKYWILALDGLIVAGMLIPTALTLLPQDASKPNYFGYKSYCAFAPFSTISLIAITALLVGSVHLVQHLLSR